MTSAIFARAGAILSSGQTPTFRDDETALSNGRLGPFSSLWVGLSLLNPRPKKVTRFSSAARVL
jgi:hypothetical protein